MGDVATSTARLTGACFCGLGDEWPDGGCGSVQEAVETVFTALAAEQSKVAALENAVDALLRITSTVREREWCGICGARDVRTYSGLCLMCQVYTTQPGALGVGEADTARIVDREIRAFVERVERRAEARMSAGNKLEGSHWMALIEELKALPPLGELEAPRP